MKHAFLILCVVAGTLRALFAQPEHIVVIRHAEKPADPADKNLSEPGRRRAESLVKFFKDNAELKKFDPPAAIYATGLGKGGKGQRCQQTIKPLAASLGLPVLTPFKAEDAAELAREVLREAKLKTIVICWTKERIPELMASLGVHPVPAKLEEDQYDMVYILDRNPTEIQVRIISQDFRP
jgi:hypothetical protein